MCIFAVLNNHTGREACHASMQAQLLNHELRAKVKILTSLYEEEVTKDINILIGKRLTEELKAYLRE